MALDVGASASPVCLEAAGPVYDALEGRLGDRDGRDAKRGDPSRTGPDTLEARRTQSHIASRTRTYEHSRAGAVVLCIGSGTLGSDLSIEHRRPCLAGP
jgi:hypothetical protein